MGHTHTLQLTVHDHNGKQCYQRPLQRVRDVAKNVFKSKAIIQTHNTHYESLLSEIRNGKQKFRLHL